MEGGGGRCGERTLPSQLTTLSQANRLERRARRARAFGRRQRDGPWRACALERREESKARVGGEGCGRSEPSPAPAAQRHRWPHQSQHEGEGEHHLMTN